MKSKNELILFDDPKSPISEIFRTLRTNIQFIDTKKNSKTILITSTFAGEGKSWVSANLAVSFAQTGKMVLLIDADMRKGRQYKIFNMPQAPGLSNYLSGVDTNGYEDLTDEVEVDEYINKTEVENLYVMTAGNVPPNPSELLNSPQMSYLLNEVKQLFDIVIIDSTPSQLVTDSLILARIVSSTFIVTACKETKREDLKRVITNIENIGGKISGVILNKVPMSAKKFKKKYYYNTQVKNNKKHLDTEGKNNKNKSKELNKESEQIPQSTATTDDILRQINTYLEKEKEK